MADGTFWMMLDLWAESYGLVKAVCRNNRASMAIEKLNLSTRGKHACHCPTPKVS